MNKIRLTKEFNFEMAHSLLNYDGLCKHIHGHSYKLAVTIIAEPNCDKNSPKIGMVMDFGELKTIVNKLIVKPLDHSLVLNSETPEEFYTSNNQLFGRLVLVDYQPTCENMVIEFAEKIKRDLPKGVNLFSIKLHETATSFAEWYASDNI
ncbi:MAG: 6-carboxytetrahydropterin synthase QueD [Bacteroidetes bacterium CG2_30_33_31]|nr:MAG: 6-carboxytetrahydropterin synthase QueD [Bacteroidetes bacterium CG2_30_33_31]